MSPAVKIPYQQNEVVTIYYFLQKYNKHAIINIHCNNSNVNESVEIQTHINICHVYSQQAVILRYNTKIRKSVCIVFVCSKKFMMKGSNVIVENKIIV